jgi:hypothetical protein
LATEIDWRGSWDIPVRSMPDRAGSRRQAGLTGPFGRPGIGDRRHKYRRNQLWMVAMETPGPDDLADDDAVIAHRARAKAELGQIARQAKQALADAGIASACSSSSRTAAMQS